MSARLRSMTASGSLLLLAALALVSGCAKRGRGFTIPVPLPLQTVVAVDRDGNRIVAGSFAGKLEVGKGALTSVGGTDIFVAKVNPKGDPIFPSQRFGGPGDDAATGVALNDDGSIVLAGTFQGEADFGGKRIKADVQRPDQRAVFVARIEATGAVGWVRQIAVANLATQVSVAIASDKNIVIGGAVSVRIPTKEDPKGQIGQSVTLQLLAPNGDAIMQPADTQVRALSTQVTCAHSPCVQGGVLTAGCGPNACVTWICSVDPFCCTTAWDGWCVQEVGTVCQMRCDCGQICTAGNAFYPDACACTIEVFGIDPYCGQVGWDGQCIREANDLCHAGCP